MSIVDECTSLLKSDSRFVSDDSQILKNKITEAALNFDAQLVALLLSQPTIRNLFFTSVGEALVFDRDKFIRFVNNKEFLPDSYTSFKNKIGLVDDSGELLATRGEVVLAWPYKDCVLEGGQTKEDQKRQEVF
jgi:adenine-specific DNA-methyltransferase